jgi:hypothetical protein
MVQLGDTRTIERSTMMNQLTGAEYTVPKKKIYIKLTHLVADNHFSG